MQSKFFVIRVFQFYREGFRSMRLGKVLWLIILLKLCIMFLILKPLFFSSYLGQFKDKAEKQMYVSEELIQRAITP